MAASAGMLLALDWKVFLIAAGVFLILFFTIHYVSVGSISAYVTAWICFVVFGAIGCYGMDLSHTVENGCGNGTDDRAGCIPPQIQHIQTSFW